MIGKRASLDERTVQAVARDAVDVPRHRRTRGSSKSSSVTVTQQHPALTLAHEAGIPSSRVEILADPPLWGAIFHNHPAPWPSSDSEQEQS